MEERNKNEELQSRREFFKKTAQNVLPFLGAVALSPLLNSCDLLTNYDPDDNDKPSGCGKSCSGSCEGDCAGDCDDNCTADCWNGCDRWQK